MRRNGCLNRFQARPDADGRYTFVLALHDPGVYNWLDPTDMSESILTLRWAEFAEGRPGPDFGVRSKLVPLSELEAVLPEGAVRVGAVQRREQLEQRAQSYAWRLAENAST